MKRSGILPIIPLVMLLASCGEQAPTFTPKKSPDGKIIVQTVNFPLFYFAKRLAGSDFDVRYIVSPDEDPAFWKPSDSDVQAFQEADLIVRNGAGYAKWIKTVSLPSRIMLDTSSGFSSALIREKGKVHQHGNGKAHQHGDVAFTTWMDFTLAQKQAQSIADRFTAMSPRSAGHIRKNTDKLNADLLSLDRRMMAFSRKWGNKPLLVSHPVYQYWAKRYGLNIRSVHWEPDMKWDNNRAEELSTINLSPPARWMIWENLPSPDLVARLKEKGIESVVFSPCANSPDKNKDWISVMKKNISALEAIKP